MKRLKFSLDILFVGILILFISACKKDNLLNERSRSDLIVPSSLSDLQRLLDRWVGGTGINLTPMLDLTSSDIFYATQNQFDQRSNIEQNAYLWRPDIYEGQGNIDDWNVPYNNIFYANVVLDQLDIIKADATNQATWNNIKSQALFLRAYNYFSLSQLFATPYDETTAISDLGLPLKLSSDINIIVGRSTLKATYNQMITDLKESRLLVNVDFPGNLRNRSSKAAIFALFARLYLSMRNYAEAGKYADSCLQVYNKLIDYNTVSAASTTPFSNNNDEIIYFSAPAFWQTWLSSSSTTGIIDTLLYNSYNSNDLRRSIYFTTTTGGTIWRKRDYSASNYPFTGLATDEIYLIRAECFARGGDLTSAMGDLNTLIKKRWRNTVTYPTIVASSQSDAINKILTERKKELLFRSRWSDLRRLNKGGANITLTRVLNGQSYTLPPNSPLYVLPIPPDELALSGIQQNPR